jgi:hypothetical protein
MLSMLLFSVLSASDKPRDDCRWGDVSIVIQNTGEPETRECDIFFDRSNPQQPRYRAVWGAQSQNFGRPNNLGFRTYLDFSAGSQSVTFATFEMNELVNGWPQRAIASKSISLVARPNGTVFALTEQYINYRYTTTTQELPSISASALYGEKIIDVSIGGGDSLQVCVSGAGCAIANAPAGFFLVTPSVYMNDVGQVSGVTSSVSPL